MIIDLEEYKRRSKGGAKQSSQQSKSEDERRQSESYKRSKRNVLKAAEKLDW